MGEVYLARDEVLGRDVALKILKKEYASQEEFRKRMGREAESGASLSNPNLVRVYDMGETKDALPYSFCTWRAVRSGCPVSKWR